LGVRLRFAGLVLVWFGLVLSGRSDWSDGATARSNGMRWS
jgi:hypothetical protein